MYAWSELSKLWEQERVTTEQVIGQLLRYGEAHEATITALRRQHEHLEQLVTSLTARVVALESGRPKV